MWNQVEKFDGRENLSACQCVVNDAIVQQRLIDTLDGNKPDVRWRMEGDGAEGE